MDTCKILEDARTIAVVGISSNPGKTSRNIARYLVKAGYEVFGVNPNHAGKEFGGIKIYENLEAIPGKIDIVDVFLRSEKINEIIDNVLAVKPKVLWLQLGIRNDEAVKPAEDAGITVIQDTCIYVEHSGCF